MANKSKLNANSEEFLLNSEAVARAFPTEKQRRVIDDDQTVRERELARLFRRATPNQQKLIIDLLSEMVIR